MKAVFEIIPDYIVADRCELVCEVSNEGFSYLIKDSGAKMFIGSGVYHFNNIIGGNYGLALSKIFQQTESLSENYKKVQVIYSFPESVLIPFSLYNSRNNAEVLNMVHGDFTENDAILTDVLLKSKVYNCYRIPSEISREIHNKFPSCEALHQYSFLMNSLLANSNRLSVIFYPQKIVLSVEKDGKILLINSFQYKTAEDVSYTLLNICRQFEIEKIPVEVSGLIEKDSALYKEIYKYFDQVSFPKLPKEINFSEEMNKYPVHFFSHFFAVDS